MFIFGAIALMVGGLVLAYHFLIREAQWKLIEFFGIMVLASMPMGGMMKYMSRNAAPLTVEDILIMIPYASIYSFPVFFGGWWANRTSKLMGVESSAAKLALVVAGSLGIVGMIVAIPAVILIAEFSISGQSRDLVGMCAMTACALVTIAPCAAVEVRCKSANAERIRERRERAAAKGLRGRKKSEGEDTEARE